MAPPDPRPSPLRRTQSALQGNNAVDGGACGETIDKLRSRVGGRGDGGPGCGRSPPAARGARRPGSRARRGRHDQAHPFARRRRDGRDRHAGSSVGGNASPHTYAMKPSDARRCTPPTSSCACRNASSRSPPRSCALPPTVSVVSLAETPGLELLDVRVGATFEGHDDQDPTTSTRRRRPSATATSGSIRRTQEDRRACRRGPVQARARGCRRPAGERGRAIRRIDALAAEIARILEPAASRPFVVFHDAYQYFEKRFGLAAGADHARARSAAERLPPPRRAPEDRSAGAGVRVRRAVPDEARGRGQRGHGRRQVLDPIGGRWRRVRTSIRSCRATWPAPGGLPDRAR